MMHSSVKLNYRRKIKNDTLAPNRFPIRYHYRPRFPSLVGLDSGPCRPLQKEVSVMNILALDPANASAKQAVNDLTKVINAERNLK